MHLLRFSLIERKQLPSLPGIYQFYDTQEQPIYVGKAKNIQKRVASYFSASKRQDIKTRTMVAQVATIACVLVKNEAEALLLESNLIKAHQPRYNILLKDGKTYPYLCITREPFPRLITTRQRTPSLGTYFGPFTDIKALDQIKSLLQKLYTLRTCRLNLSPEAITKKKFTVCLQYHIGNCLGPCQGHQSHPDYLAEIQSATYLLKGGFPTVKKALKEKMHSAAQALHFERAQTYKEKIDAIEAYQARSIITQTPSQTIDTIAIISDQARAFLSYLHISHGRLLFVETLSLEKKLAESDSHLAALTLTHFRKATTSQAKSVLSNVPIPSLSQGVSLTIPKAGEKKKLLDMALRNALFFKRETLKREATSTTRSPANALIQLQQALKLPLIPTHIECFDTSHLQGTHPVAAMVSFLDGRPAKHAYRHYHIRSVTAPDDFAYIGEVIYRRYQRLLAEKRELPTLLIVDGGKGQLNVAITLLKELGIYGKMALIGMAKKLEEIYFPADPHPLRLPKNAPSLHLLQQIRDEAHRFAHTFHQATRIQRTLRSSLQEIPGVGPATLDRLFRTFGTLTKMRKATIAELTQAIGEKRAAAIQRHFSKE